MQEHLSPASIENFWRRLFPGEIPERLLAAEPLENANCLASSPRAAALVWILSFVWMGTGCLLNARRCHRLHCYISGPAFFLGAATLAFFAAGVALLGPHSLNNIVGVTLAVVLLSFVPEMVWRQYL